MSWSAYGDVQGGQQSFHTTSGIDGGNAETAAQFEAARNALDLLIDSGAVGPVDGNYKVSLAGHGNPNHEKVPGVTNDAIVVTVAQV